MTIKGSFTARPQVLAAAAKWSAKFLAAKPAQPIQGGVLLDIADGCLTLSTYGESARTRAVVDVDGAADGRAVISGRLLAGLVDTFPNKPITIEGDGDDVVLSAGRFRATMPTMNEDDWPTQPDSPSAVASLVGSAFADAVARVAVTASKDLSSRIALAGVHMSVHEDRIELVASDSYRASGISVPCRIAGPDVVGSTALVLASVLDDIAAAFVGPDEITIGIDPGGALSFTSPNRSIATTVLGAEYDADAIRRFLAHVPPNGALVKVSDMLAPMKRAAMMQGKNGPVQMTFTSGLVNIIAKADDTRREGDEEVDAEYDGPEVPLVFNPGYLGDALSTAPGDTVRIGFSEAGKAVVLTSPTDPAWTHVLMSLRALVPN